MTKKQVYALAAFLIFLMTLGGAFIVWLLIKVLL